MTIEHPQKALNENTEGDVVMRLVEFPANQAWGFIFGRDFNSADIVQMGDGARFFEWRGDAIKAAMRQGLKVDASSGIVTSDPLFAQDAS